MSLEISGLEIRNNHFFLINMNQGSNNPIIENKWKGKKANDFSGIGVWWLGRDDFSEFFYFILFLQIRYQNWKNEIDRRIKCHMTEKYDVLRTVWTSVINLRDRILAKKLFNQEACQHFFPFINFENPLYF